MNHQQPGEEENYKNQLNGLCQRITGESMGKTDILYETKRQPAGFQATVTLVCLSGQQAAGEVAQTDKAAEQSAALFALVTLQSQLTSMGQSVDKTVHELSPAMQVAACAVGINSQEEMTDLALKAMMHESIKQVLERKLEKGDINYEYAIGSRSGTYVAQLRLPTIPGAIGQTVFTGEESAFRRDSQVECIVKALDALLSDVTFGCRIDLTGKIKIKSMHDKKSAERQARAKRMAGSSSSGMKGGFKGKAVKGMGKGSKVMPSMQTMLLEQNLMSMAMKDPQQLTQMMTMMNMMNMMNRGGGPYSSLH